MKIFAVTIVCLLFTFASLAQEKTPLDEKLSKAFRQNFSDWQAEDADQPFYPVIRGGWKFNPAMRKDDKVSGLESVWTLGERRAGIRISLETPEEREFSVRMFLTRNVTPPSEKIENLGDEAYLVQFRYRVEVAFVKGNLFARVNLDIPNRPRKLNDIDKVPPQEIDTALKMARLVAAEINGEQSDATLTALKKE